MTIKQKWAALAAAIVVIALVAGLFVWFSADETTTPPTAAPPTTVTPAPAQTGNGETGFADPATDALGRKVSVPNNPAGQPLPQRDPGPRIECNPAQLPTPQGGMSIQRNFDMAMLYSETDGPVRLNGDIPVGYSHSPQGAVLAAWNIWRHTLVGGDVTKQVLLTQTVHDDVLQKTLETETLPGSNRSAEQKRRTVVPDGFRLLSCDNDFVVVEYAQRQVADENGRLPAPRWMGLQMTMLWRDGDWKMQLTDESTKAGQIHPTLDGFTTWQF